MNAMKVLHTIAARDWGGIACRVVDQALWTNRNGHECWLACPSDSAVAAGARRAGVPTIGFDFDRPFAPSTILALRHLVRRLDCQVIETHTGRCANAAMFCRDRAVVIRTRHTTQTVKPSLTRYLRWRMAWDWTIVTADVIAQDLLAAGLVPHSRLDVIGEWAAERFFDRSSWPVWRAETRQSLGVAEDDILVGSVGMLRPEKGFDHLLRAVATLSTRCPRLKTVIVGSAAGDAGWEHHLRSLASELGLDGRVIFTGYRSDVAPLLQALDLVAVPSTFEAQSRVIPEAFASARPVVASDVGGIGELVLDGVTGWLVPPASPESLSRVIASVYEDPGQALAIRTVAGRFATERLTIDAGMHAHMAVYEAAWACRRTSPFRHLVLSDLRSRAAPVNR
ncbi:MAG: glycosyltransferase family 4 protein [Telmatospirillum sp.]|nr:glycosyltransferase family 4 protein [Telmatospirillum sp.]